MTPTRMTLVDLLSDRLRALDETAQHAKAQHAASQHPAVQHPKATLNRPRSVELTDREHAVAAMVGEALSNKQIAKRMLISPHTVNYHLRQIYRKLEINSRLQLAQHLRTWV